MERKGQLRVLYADRLEGGVIIGFSNGKCAIYSAELLHSVLPEPTLILEDTGIADVEKMILTEKP